MDNRCSSINRRKEVSKNEQNSNSKMNKKPSTVLVTGGAGYIGIHVLLELIANGMVPVVIDNLSRGIRGLIPNSIPLIVTDIENTDVVRNTIREFNVDTVIHLAGSVVVPESKEKPLQYYKNNVDNSRGLLEICVQEKINKFIFASTAAVYGSTKIGQLNENAIKDPVSPYGRSKLMIEWIIKDVAAVHELNYVILRFFNVAGADQQLRAGQVGLNNTHLIKVACEVAAGTQESIEIFGTDYPTPDGTCVRDYIHVSDLVSALIASVKHLESNGENSILNCGYGQGNSVRQILDAINKAHGTPLNIIDGKRRAGDPAVIVADSSLIRNTLNWEPKYTSIESIVRTALAWENSRKSLALLAEQN